MNDDIAEFAGFRIPPSIQRAIDHARASCPPYLFNHVVRSWLFAIRLGRVRKVHHDAEVLAIGTLLHDITLNERFSGPRRFEVEGADLARSFVRELGFDDRRSQLIWDSVALNSTPSIGLHKEPEVALCTGGVCLDVVGLAADAISTAERDMIVQAFPRLNMKRQMTRCFVHLVEQAPATTHDNFLRDFGDRFVPDYRAQSSVDLVQAAPFDD
ncbi:hypothetical protein GON01_02745 [Sphingomonas sp. MAH-20]|uniref:HD domain-containing protein n=1 Tax=Sphingomonas horti TaxID=2682842 RepID=A0A6I4IXQ7_9SPHN|nr:MULTISPECIES: hypothetical protein [Sphingomonas]MBA2920870.1 hypothetical protein [Sphingomonas sp. CGMCC 1.13658]MVO76856.1 hypothetical protein [Sphingomonas horti]